MKINLKKLHKVIDYVMYENDGFSYWLRRALGYEHFTMRLCGDYSVTLFKVRFFGMWYLRRDVEQTYVSDDIYDVSYLVGEEWFDLSFSRCANKDFNPADHRQLDEEVRMAWINYANERRAVRPLESNVVLLGYLPDVEPDAEPVYSGGLEEVVCADYYVDEISF